MRNHIHQIIEIMKYLICILLITLEINVCSGQEKYSFETQNLIDSIKVSKNDGFFQYSLFDIFLNSKGYLYFHELSRNIYKTGKNETQRGSLRKVVINKSFVNDFLTYISTYISSSNLEIKDPIKSDQSLINLELYSNGELLENVSFTMNVENEELKYVYSKLDSIVNSNQDWSQWNLNRDIPLLGELEIDSILIIEHIKNENGYFRNGIKDSITLLDEEKDEFISKLNNLKSYVPYQNKSYSVLTGRTEKYGILIYFNNKIKYMNYDGQRIMKESFLHYQTKNNIAKKLLKSKKY